MRSRPYAYPVFPLNGNHASFDNHIERRLSALQNKFADREAFQAMVDAGDPLVYERSTRTAAPRPRASC